MSAFNGYPAVHERPGAYRVRKRLPSATYTNTLINFRTADYFGQAGVHNAEDAIERGELKRVDIALVSGTSIAPCDDAGDYAAGNYNTADATRPVIRTDYANGEHAYRQWWTSSGAVVLEVEVWFDVPPAVFP